MPIVTTGQLTIVDNNDARSISAVLTASSGTQQVYTSNDSITPYLPSWFTNNLILTPQVSVGGLTAGQAWAALINKKFCLTANGTALTTASTSSSFVNDAGTIISAPFTVTHASTGSTTASTFTVKGNLLDSVGQFTVFFDADYVDVATGLTTHITCQITLNTVKTGTNAVFINLRGTTVIEESTSNVKNVAAVAADLIRAGTVDTTNLTYQWFENGGSTQITNQLSGYLTKYGAKSTSSATAPTGSQAELGAGLPTTNGGSNANNTIIISETAVTDLGVYKVVVTDTEEGKSYATYFTISDLSDPYECLIISSAGDKLQNGQGSTTLSPKVYYGATSVDVLTGWTFTWYFYDRNGKRGGFVDTGKISAAGGGTITANTTGSGASFSSTSVTSGLFTAGNLIKCVKANGDAFFYEVGATSTSGSVSIRTPTASNPWLSFVDFAAPTSTSDFVGGKIFGCTTNGIRTTSAAASFVLSGDDVDVKARILVEANRP
jgi:hypothetical protein